MEERESVAEEDRREGECGRGGVWQQERSE